MQGMQSYCFCLLNMQICNVLVAVAVVVAKAPYCLSSLLLNRRTATWNLFVNVIFALVWPIKAIAPKKHSCGFNGIQTHDLCDTDAMFYELSYEASQLRNCQFIGIICSRERADEYIYISQTACLSCLFNRGAGAQSFPF